MSSEAYELTAMTARYVFAALMLWIVWRACRGAWIDSRRAARLRRLSPMTGLCGEMVVVEGEGQARRGMRYPVIREGTIGSSRRADIRIRHASVRRRHAYFQLTEAGLSVRGHAGARLRDGDGHLVRELMLVDGDALSVGNIRLLLVLSMPEGVQMPEREERAAREPDDLFDAAYDGGDAIGDVRPRRAQQPSGEYAHGERPDEFAQDREDGRPGEFARERGNGRPGEFARERGNGRPDEWTRERGGADVDGAGRERFAQSGRLAGEGSMREFGRPAGEGSMREFGRPAGEGSMREFGRPAGEGSMREFGRPAGNVPARGVSPNGQEVPNRGGRNRPASTYSRPDADPRRHDGVNADAGSLQRESAGPGLRAAVCDGFNAGDFSDAEARYRRPARDDFDVDETLYGGKTASARARDDFDVDETLYGGKATSARVRDDSDVDETLYGGKAASTRARDDFDVDETLYGGKSTSARARDDFDIDEALYGDPRGNARGTGGGSEADEALYGAPRRKKHRRR